MAFLLSYPALYNYLLFIIMTYSNEKKRIPIHQCVIEIELSNV